MQKTTYRAVDAAYKALKTVELFKLTEIERLRDERDDAQARFENHRESWFESEVASEEGDRICALDAAIEEIETAAGAVDNAITHIEAIMETAPEGAFNP